MPAVLTLCTCGDYALLGRNSKWPRGFYSTPGGVRGPVREPGTSGGAGSAGGVGRRRSTSADDDRVASSAVAFPCQLMVGFEAKAAPRTVELTDKSARDITKTFCKNCTPSRPTWTSTSCRTRAGSTETAARGARETSAIRASPGTRARFRSAPSPCPAPRARQAPHRALGVRGWFGNRLRVRRSRDIEFELDRAIELGRAAAAPRAAINRPHTFVCVDFVGAGGGTRTALRIQPTGGRRAHRERPRAAPRGCRARRKREADRARNKRKTAEKRNRIVAPKSRRLERRHERCSSHTYTTRLESERKRKTESESKEGESFRVLGAGQLCFRGGEVSENSVHDDERGVLDAGSAQRGGAAAASCPAAPGGCHGAAPPRLPHARRAHSRAGGRVGRVSVLAPTTRPRGAAIARCFFLCRLIRSSSSQTLLVTARARVQGVA